MSEQHTTTVWASESDYDALESQLSGAGIPYERSQLTQFSTDPTPFATIITISVVAVPALASVLRAYLKERKRRIVVAKPDGTKLIAENHTVEEVERLLRACAEDTSAEIYIDASSDGDTKT